MKTRLLFFLFPVLMFSIAARAQGTATPKPVPPPTITRPGSIQDTGLWGYWTQLTDQDRVGGALFGKVMVQGGPLLWEPILVSVNCKGAMVQTTQSDAKGQFVITSTRVQGALSLQQDAKRQMETHYEGCTVQASLAGFQSSSITITQRNLRDDPELGTIALTREKIAPGTAMSGTTESAPADAVKSFEKARIGMLEQKENRAQRELKKTVQIYPQFAEAWYQLGRLQGASGSQDARESFTKAVAADPKFVPPYEHLAALAAQDGKWQEVVNNTGHALQLDPAGTPRTWYFDALGDLQLGKIDAAQASALQSLALDPSHTIPNTEQLLAVVLVRKRDYKGALDHLRNCLTYLPSGPNADLVKRQIAQLEQGLGAAK
jgi:tetratricopeptide (TPR) repeat protein